MLRQLRALFHIESPLPDSVHFHLDEAGRKVLCDSSRCRPDQRPPQLLFPSHW